MISRTVIVFSTLIIVIGVVLSCSQGLMDDSPVTPDPESEVTIPDHMTQSDSGRYLWAYTLIAVDPDSGSIDVIPVRETVGHWNVLKFLEQGPCTNCVSVTGVTTNSFGNKEFTVEISHPFTIANLTGFDVRGIAIFDAGYTFDASGHTTGFGTTGELVNPDGYTSLYTASTAGSGPAGLQGYLKGKFASLTVPDSTLNGYKRHISSDSANTRNAFYAGDSITATYEIKMPTSAFVFGYAVDASWVPPATTPVTDPMTDFPPEANCFEPWKIVVTQNPVGTGLTELGGMTVLQIDVYDWQGMGSIMPPVVECSDLFSGTVTAYSVSDYGTYSRWAAEIQNLNLASPGSYKCLVSVEDVENSIMPSWIDLTACQIVNTTVNSSSAVSTGWARTWGGSGEDVAANVAVDTAGNVYVTGGFADLVDFDPGPSTDNHDAGSLIYTDAYLTKFDTTGTFQWAKSWGSSHMDIGKGIVVDVGGSVYVAGAYYGTVDFDPDAGVQNRTSSGGLDAYILKLDPSGAFQWVITWGGSQNDVVNTLSNNGSGDLFAGGYFEGTCDFDPGSGTDSRTSNGNKDAFCAMYDYLSGVFLGVYTFGGVESEVCNSVDASGSSSFVYMGGYYSGSADFDPGSLTDLHASNGFEDAFLCQLGSASCNWLWARTWGGSDSDECTGVAALSTGDVYTTGYFSNLVDFNPGASTVNKSSKGGYDPYMSIFNASGTFVDVVTWGGTGDIEATGVVINEPGMQVYVTGTYRLTCDFNSGSGADNRTSAGLNDCFISRFDTSGTWNLTRTWGGTSYDIAYGAAVQDSTGDVIISGIYGDIVNFDLSGGTDTHTAVVGPDMFVGKYSSDIDW